MASSISIILPAHNEAENLVRTVREAIHAMQILGVSFEVVIVDDGSTDRTPRLVTQLITRDPRIRAVQHESRRGYGAALRSGFQAAKCDLVFFTDADGQFRFDELGGFLDCMSKADLIIGYRVSRQDAWYRKLNSRIGNLLARTLIGVAAKDINCAYKLMWRAALDRLRLTSDGAMVNSELLVLAQREGWKCCQLPVRHYPRQHGRATGGNRRVILKTIREFFQLRRRLERCPSGPKCANLQTAKALRALDPLDRARGWHRPHLIAFHR